jgi:hypothetical protein
MLETAITLRRAIRCRCSVLAGPILAAAMATLSATYVKDQQGGNDQQGENDQQGGNQN